MRFQPCNQNNVVPLQIGLSHLTSPFAELLVISSLLHKVQDGFAQCGISQRVGLGVDFCISLIRLNILWLELIWGPGHTYQHSVDSRWGVSFYRSFDGSTQRTGQ